MAEFKRVENDPASARLRDAHIELYLMLVRASSPLSPWHDICTGRSVSAVPVSLRECSSLCPLNQIWTGVV